MKVVDSYCGIVILAVYFTYFLVVKGMLSAFDCTKNDDGIPFLDAEPSLRCDNVSPFAPSPSVVSFGFYSCTSRAHSRLLCYCASENGRLRLRCCTRREFRSFLRGFCSGTATVFVRTKKCDHMVRATPATSTPSLRSDSGTRSCTGRVSSTSRCVPMCP
jgi:hypothetical protein